MKILIVSQELWTNTTNGGNVLSSLFDKFDAEFAQVYCWSGEPQNTACKRYYQISDKMILNNVLFKRKCGCERRYDDYPNKMVDILDNTEEKNFYSFFRRFRLEIFYTFRELLWDMADWKTEELVTFIKAFNPDIIFAPLYGNVYMQKVIKFIIEVSGCSAVSYVSDDIYSMKQMNFSPIYWLNRMRVRKIIRKIAPSFSIIYTMTEEQKKEYEYCLKCSMKILRKGVSLSEINESVEHTPIRMIYAGSIYCKRWVTLMEIGKAIQEINRNGVKVILSIYTKDELNKSQKRRLDDKVNTFTNKAVPYEELKQLYKQQDIALHVESFDLKHRGIVRLSFSTKIVDCLGSGCAVMAICSSEQAGFKYLYKEDAAICINKIEKIKETLEELINNQEIINTYKKKAITCLKKNHNILSIQNEIKKDFYSIKEGTYEFEDGTELEY